MFSYAIRSYVDYVGWLDWIERKIEVAERKSTTLQVPLLVRSKIRTWLFKTSLDLPIATYFQTAFKIEI